ncbi:MAG: hypothetical protein HQ513_10415, partial [Rhodospirillales bacterium]|nr:hypothetical protein [Rhodospirillales bacterium]
MSHLSLEQELDQHETAEQQNEKGSRQKPRFFSIKTRIGSPKYNSSPATIKNRRPRDS